MTGEETTAFFMPIGERSRNHSPWLLDINPLFGEKRSKSEETQSVFRDKRRLFADNPRGKEAGMGRPHYPEEARRGRKLTYTAAERRKLDPGARVEGA